MKKLQQYSLLSLMICSHATHGMLVNKKCVQVLKSAHNRNYGLETATMPQTSKGALGTFRLDKKYGVRDYLAQYIALNKNISLADARWEDFNAIERAYKQFVMHNSSAAIEVALENNVIDKDYAEQALYFTYKVVTELKDHIEFNQHFAQHYSQDPEQYIWVDNDAFKKNRNQLLYDAEREQKAIIELVDFLQQKPVTQTVETRKRETIFKKPPVSHGWSYHTYLPIQKRPSVPKRIAHVHDGVLGAFNVHEKYTIQEYLQKYLKKQDDKIEWRALKKAYDDFLFYNMPSRIRDAFITSEKIKNKKIKVIWSGRPIVENVTQKEVEDAFLFTQDVACAMQQYLGLDGNVCPALQGDAEKLTDKDVQLFALLGAAPAAIAQPWDGVLGNFSLNNQQAIKARCTIKDYLCKYIARNLQIPESAVATEATFLDIKKAFDQFVNHNHPEAILRDFEHEKIGKQHAKDALQFTRWVVDAFEEYLSDFKDDSYEVELFELFWQIERMKEKGQGMRFVEKGEWSSSARE